MVIADINEKISEQEREVIGSAFEWFRWIHYRMEAEPDDFSVQEKTLYNDIMKLGAIVGCD